MFSLFLLAFPAWADLPLAPTPQCSEKNQAACPEELPGSWELLSWVPDDTSVRPAEKRLGSGISADIAFRHATGRWDVTVAVLDSGIYWQEESLYPKIRLNAAELPRPQNAAGVEVDDLDGNGLLNLFDYAEDARVDITAGVDTTDDRLDPSDLIYTFSDGKDDDGNGYVDDIAGWDFFGDDNDPYAELQGLQADHGTGVMRTAAQGGNDGGGIGVCPNCSVLPVRIGDAFVVEGDRAGLGIAFAADSGARAVGMAVGGLTQPSLVVEAARYADKQGVVMVGAAGDENSYHHNYPAASDPFLYVHSIRGDNMNEDGPEVVSFMSIWNCNNWGPRLDLVAPANGCATGSVAMTTGAAGLVVSAGLDHGIDLTPDEVKALLLGTVDEINLSEREQAEVNGFPSHPGWDPYFGAGRLNVGAAVEAIVAGELPPVARIDAPTWFTWVDPDGPAFEVRGVVDSRHDAVRSWVIEVGHGLDPGEWHVVAEGTGAKKGVLASVEPYGWGNQVFFDLEDETLLERVERAHRPMVVFRLTVTDKKGRKAQVRRGVWVHRDPDLMPGWPKRMPASMESGPVLADLNGDDVFEVVLPTSDGQVHALFGDGSPVPGFPVQTAVHPQVERAAAAYASGEVGVAHEGILGGVAVGDLDGDGTPEVVAVSLSGRAYAWHNDGRLLKGFPVSIIGRAPEEFGVERAWENGIAATPALGDADGDGDLDIIVGGMDQRLYVWDEAGRTLHAIELCTGEYCTTKGARILSSAAVGDIDGDGALDAVVGTNELPPGEAGALYMVNLKTGKIWPGWPQGRDGLINQAILPLIGEGHPSSPVLADVDGDGDLEFASTAMLGSSDIEHHDNKAAIDLVYTADGFGDRSPVTEGGFLAAVTNPSFGDMNLDGRPDFVLGGAGLQWAISLALTEYFEYQHAVGAWDLETGEAFPHWPRQVDDVAFLMAAAIAEISGDVLPEAIYASGGHFIYAWDAFGRSADGWPKFTGGWSLGGAAVGDIDGDGFVDVVLGTREGTLFAWRTKGSAGQQVQWASGRHDAQNTGNHATPLPQQAGPVVSSGGCCKKDGKGGAWLVLLPLWTLWRRPR